MIQAHDKENVVKYFGKQYSRKLIPKLLQLGVFTATGKPFSSRTLNWVINGNTENLEVEKAIFLLINELKKERKEVTNLRKRI